MSAIEFVGFKGIKSEVSPKLLEPGFSVQCTNAFLDSGALVPLGGLEEVFTLGKTNTINSLHLLNNETWLHYNENVELALSTIANNDKHLTIITGLLDHNTWYTDKDLATAGAGTSYPNSSFVLGFPQPATTLQATVGQGVAEGIQFQWSISGTEDDTVGNKLTYSYVYTYADGDGREGSPSTPSNIAYASVDDKITLTNFDQITGLIGPYNPVGAVMRIYRSESGGPYQFMIEVPTGTTSWIDEFSIAAGDAIETTTWSAPPDDLRGIVTLANGMMAGYVGNDLYISEPYQPHAWPEDYILHVDYPITGLASSGNTVIVATEKYPYIGVGNHPSVFTLNKLETIQANLNIKSMIDIGDGAMYASQDGIVMVTMSGASVVSKDIISEKTWQSMNPSSIHAVFYREKYLGFYSAIGSGDIETENGETIPAQGSFIFDPVKGHVAYFDIWGSASYSDLNSGELYIVQNELNVNKVYKWDAGDNLEYVWKSKPVVVNETTMTAARLESDTGNTVFKLYADGVLKHTETLPNSSIMKIGGTDSQFDASAYSIEGYTDGCTAKIKQASLAKGMFGLSSNPTLNTGYQNIEFCMYINNGNLIVYEDGNNKGTKGTYVPSDIIEISYDGTDVFYKKNGSVIYTSLNSLPGLTLYFDTSLSSSNCKFTDVQFHSNPLGVEGNEDITLINHANTRVIHINRNSIFRMPSGYNSKEFQIELSGNGVVDACFIATDASSIP